MKRLIASMLAAVAVAAAVLASLGAAPPQGDRHYEVELDNAFGLIEGADVKVAGVRAGRIDSFEVDPKTYRAVVDFTVTERGFGDLRVDAFCESRSQSLIGEYFLDCKPGTNKRKLPLNGRIPVEQTASTIPVDLVNNIMRRPYRERFSILLGELGAALAARGEDLNETIRRANPALRETNKVLAALADQRAVIRELTTDAERVVGALADRRTEVSRFIREARDTSRASAARYEDLRGQFQQFPTFLRELRPTMRLLGEAADRQTPALTNLSRNAPLLRRFLDDLGPFSEASRPSFRTLAGAARQGRGAVRASRPRVTELAAFAALLPEVVTNLAVTLEHLDDRRFATEPNPDSPEGKGFTGYEAILQYIFRQSQATNVYDRNSYLLKVSAFLDNLCAQYTDAEQARAPQRKRCRANLGPTQPGVDTPDPTKTPEAQQRRATRRRGAGRRDAAGDGSAPQASEERRGDGEGARGPELPDLNLPPEVQKLLDDVLRGVETPKVAPLERDAAPLLDFLLGG